MSVGGTLWNKTVEVLVGSNASNGVPQDTEEVLGLICWPHVFMVAQFLLGGFILVRALLLALFGQDTLLNLLRGKPTVKRVLSREEWDEQHESLQKFLGKTGEGGAVGYVLQERKKHHDFEAYYKNQSIFISHVRTEDNFIRGNLDPGVKRPPPSPLEVEPSYSSRVVLYNLLWQAYLPKLFPICLGSAMIAGGIGTKFCLMHGRSGEDDFIMVSQAHVGTLMGHFKWLPTFMLSGHLAFYVQRWRQFIFAAWSAEGRLKDLGIIIGCSVRNANDLATRKLMFKIYRYMVLAMMLQYRKIIPRLQSLTDQDLLSECERLGLLTDDERPVLQPSGTRMRDTVLAWMAREVHLHGPSQRKLIGGQAFITIMDKISILRGQMMYFHGNNFFPQPNLLRAFMALMIDVLCFLMVVSYPNILLEQMQHTLLPGVQMYTIITVFLMTLGFWGAEILIDLLAKPFDNEFAIDTFNIDALIAGTELTIFTSLRASFDDKDRED